MLWTYKYTNITITIIIKCFVQLLSDGAVAVDGKLNRVQAHIKEIHLNALYTNICGSRNQIGKT